MLINAKTINYIIEESCLYRFIMFISCQFTLLEYNYTP